MSAASRSWGWEVDPLGLQQATDALAVRLPVVVRRGPEMGVAGLIGSYHFHEMTLSDDTGRSFPAGYGHMIHVSTQLDADAASANLWHELIHAWQAEQLLGKTAVTEALPRGRAPDELKSAISELWSAKRAEHSIPYFDRPSEIEARAGESFADDIPLVRAILPRTPLTGLRGSRRRGPGSAALRFDPGKPIRGMEVIQASRS